MLVFIRGACQCFLMFCNLPIPLGNGSTVPAYIFIVAGLGIILAFQFIRGMFG